jgi:hypothetical protein
MNITIKPMMRTLLAGLLLAATSTIASAQVISVTAGQFTKVGLSGGQFLKIGVGARGTGMAGAFSAISNDVTSVYWNPAGLADVKNYAADLTTTFYFAGMNHNFAGMVLPISDKFRAAVSFTSFSSGDINVTSTDRPDGTGGIYNVNDISIGLSFAGYLTEQFSFGVTAKFVQHAFTTMTAGGIVFDVGTRYNTGFNGLLLGFAISGLGSKQSYDGAAVTQQHQPISGLPVSPLDMNMLTSSFNLPLVFRAGLGLDMFNGTLSDKPEVDEDGTVIHKWLVSGDFETYSDVPEQFAIGTEYTFREFVSFRAGYRIGHDQFGLAGGIGLKYDSGDFQGSVDYSINPTVNLGLVNRIGVTMRFN